MQQLDKNTENVLKRIYDQLNTKQEISISSPEYDKAQIDMLIQQGLLSHIDASTLSDWGYIVRGTYEGRTYFDNKVITIRDERKRNAVEVIKWLIPTIISIIALIVSIIK